MKKLKIYKVTFNDGGWHESLPSVVIVSDSDINAIKKAREENPVYDDWKTAWATEFKVEGYSITVTKNK